jgi:hypothetical protein
VAALAVDRIARQPVRCREPGSRAARPRGNARRAAAAVTGTVEGIVGGARRSIPLRLDTTPNPGVFAVRRQWPAEGTWLLRISLQNTTAIVSLDGDRVAGVRVPVVATSDGSIPRAVGAREIDSTLSAAARR